MANVIYGLPTTLYSLVSTSMQQAVSDTWGGRSIESSFEFFNHSTQAIATSIGSLFSSTDSFIRPSKSIDIVSEQLIKNLPANIVQIILGYDENLTLNIVDIVQQKNEISDFVKMAATTVDTFDYKEYSRSIENIPTILQLFKNVKELRIPSLSEENCITIPKLEKVQALAIDLRLQYAYFDRVLEKFPTLQALKLQFLHSSNLDLSSLEKLTDLKILDLSECRSYENLKQLGNLQALKVLALEHRNITDTGLASLAKLSDLKIFSLFSSGVVDVSFDEHENLRTLKALALVCSSITNKGFASLANLSNLQMLILCCDQNTNVDITLLGEIRALKALALYCVDIADAGLASLTNLPNLQILCLACTGITNEGVALLVKLPALKILYLSCNDITEAEVALFAKLSTLQTLCLGYHSITEAGLDALKNLKLQNLMLISLRGTMPDLQEMKTKLKETLITQLNAILEEDGCTVPSFFLSHLFSQ